MYTPPAFKETDVETLHALMREARLCTLVTATASGLIGTPLPLLVDADEGPHGVLYGHVARANPQWNMPPIGEALAIFMGAEAYITPTAYAAKREHQRVVPTWNYEAVHAYGPIEFFDDPDRLLAVVTRLTDLHEQQREQPWSVDDAPADYIRAHLRAIVGLRIPIARLEGKRKMSQNRSAEDRAGVATTLAASDRQMDRKVAGLIPQD